MPGQPDVNRSSASSAEPAIAEHILTEAATWLMELHEGPLSPGEQARLEQWRQRSAQHALAWERASALQNRFNTLPAGGAIALKAMAEPTQRRRHIKMVAALLVAAPAGWLAWRLAPWPQPDGVHRTATGERRQLLLADGTRVNLNTDTEIAVTMRATERHIALRRGEIVMETAQENQAALAGVGAPLLVSVAEGRLRPLGTRFAVRQFDGRSQVAVYAGAVEITPQQAPAARTVIASGRQALFSSAQVASSTPADEASTAWQTGMLIADQMPLAEFLAELARYRRGLLHCAPAVAELTVSGAFPLADTDAVLALLAQTMPVRLQYRTRYWVTVQAAAMETKNK